jgi:hypothetical protein
VAIIVMGLLPLGSWKSFKSNPGPPAAKSGPAIGHPKSV